MSKRAERKTPRKIHANYRTFSETVLPIIPGPLPPFRVQADPGQRAKTVDKAYKQCATRPKRTSRRDS